MKERLAGLVAERDRVLEAFLASESDRIALCCYELARAFSRGGTLLAYGTGAAATDAAHVAVEFMHPVIVGKRALPALAPPADVRALARAGDVALTIAHEQEDPAVRDFREEMRRRGLLTVAFTGGTPVEADFAFAVPTDDPQVAQEVQETAYHVLWELVHVFFEHPGLLASRSGAGEAGTSAPGRLRQAYGAEACITCGDVAVEAEVVAVRGSTAVIEKDGVREEVAVELVDVAVGDRVLCHAGVALERL
jgi:D-sedoheptulose 7-phosphate isomerase